MALEVEIAAEGPIPLDARLRVEASELVGLVGPSGAGKSTLLRVIAGLWRRAHGQVAVDGQPWMDSVRGVLVPTHRRRVGLVPQSYALFPHMTAEGNVAAALGHLPRRARAERARELLDMVHLDGLGARRPAEMSGGQQQRVALARALARDPQALLLDEPFSAVDRATRERLYREIAELRRSLAMPALLVTHDLEEAARLCDRIVVLHGGRTLQEGTPETVMHRPATAEIARLVGVRNVFAAEADAGGLDWAGLRLEAPPEAPRAGPVRWVVPEGFVVLHRRDRPSRGEHENPVPGEIAEMLVLGQVAEIVLRPRHAPEPPLHFSVPLHVARRNGLAPGATATVSLLTDGIHVLDPETRAAAGARQDAA